MSLPRYSAYKPSSVEWFGEVPNHWQAKRLKTEASYCVSNVDKVPSDDELPVRLCNYTDVYYNDQITPDMGLMETTATAEEIRKFGLRVNDVLITKDSEEWSDIAVPAMVAETAPDLVCGYHLAIIRPAADRLYGKFLLRALQSSAVNQQFQIAASGVTRYGLPKSSIGEAWLPLPPLEEQQTIADFLDAQTAKIDTLLAKKRQFIAKLKEKRSALIARTVTRGLPPDAGQAAGLEPHPAMKDSGVEWLGEIPSHWKVKRLKFVFPRLYSGVSVNSESTPTEEDFPGVLKTSCVYGNQFYPNENKRVLEGETDRIACPVTRDSLIISRMNTPDLVGNCGYVEHDYPNLFLPDRLWIARFQNHLLMHGKFAWYLVSSHGVNQLTGILATGTSGSMKNLSQDAFLNIAIAIPSSKEQQAIAAYLDRETTRIDQLTAKVESATERLTEYRQALITAAVTGKIDVRARTVG